jgi:hypothetical protein
MPSLDSLRELIGLAAAAGIDPQTVRGAADELVALALEIGDLQRQADPRKRSTTELARRVAKADASLRRIGMTNGRIPVLAERFGRSTSRIHALLAISCDTQEI